MKASVESVLRLVVLLVFFFFQAEDGIRDYKVTGVQTCALPILPQYSPVQPTGRSHPATRMRLASAAQVRPARGRAVGMAPKISPRCLPAPGAKEGGSGWR